MTLTLYRFGWEAYTDEEIDGLFVADSDQVEAAIGHDVVFLDVDGRAEIEGSLDVEDLTIITQDPDLIETLRGLFRMHKPDTLCGRNPLYFLVDENGRRVKYPLKTAY